MLDPYAVLEVEPGAPLPELKKAYRRLARQWHPDRNPSPKAEARFREIASAWEILGDPDQRRRHDLQQGAVRRGELPEPFIEDVADAIERAEHWIRESVLPHYAGYWRGNGAEMAARLLADQDELIVPKSLEMPGWWGRRRARKLAEGVVVTAWLQPAYEATVVVRGRGFWEVGVVPFALWERGFRDSGVLDEAVMRLLLARYAQVVAAGRLPWGDVSLEDARSIDDLHLRRRNLRWLSWGLIGGVLGSMLLAGYNQW